MNRVAIIDKLTFERAKLNKSGVFQELDLILFPDGQKSLLNMDLDTANMAIADKLEQCMKKGSLPGNFIYFSELYSEGTVEIKYTDTVRKMVSKIMQNQEMIRKNINKPRGNEVPKNRKDVNSVWR